MNLYVSDLDGTLLNSNQEVSKQSSEIINNLIDTGLKFTVATARPGIHLTKAAINPLRFRVPIVIGNGAVIYDLSQKKRVKCNFVDNRNIDYITNAFSKFNLMPAIYTINGKDETKIYYKDISNECDKRSMSDKIKKDSNMFVKVDDFGICNDKDIIYISVSVEKEKAEPLYNLLKSELDMQITYHEDNYAKGFYWVEIANKEATKKAAVMFLKEYTRSEKVICFGDNLNDKGMFEAADYKYAVSNACQPLRELATRVIGSNNDNGVAEFLREHYRVIK